MCSDVMLPVFWCIWSNLIKRQLFTSLCLSPHTQLDTEKERFDTILLNLKDDVIQTKKSKLLNKLDVFRPYVYIAMWQKIGFTIGQMSADETMNLCAALVLWDLNYKTHLILECQKKISKTMKRKVDLHNLHVGWLKNCLQLLIY